MNKIPLQPQKHINNYLTPNKSSLLPSLKLIPQPPPQIIAIVILANKLNKLKNRR